MNDRLNQLKQYMDFFNQNNLGPGPAYVGRDGGRVEQGGAVAYTPMFAANWANDQIRNGALNDAMEQARVVPNFFGGAPQSGFTPSQYQPPQYTPGGENPYQPRAAQLNNDPRAWTNQLAALRRVYG